MQTGNGRFDDARLDALEAALDDTKSHVAYFDALLHELIAGARNADDEVERERYGTQALIVSASLTASRNALTIAELETRLEELASMTRDRLGELAEAMRIHDGWAHDEALAGNEWRQREDGR